MNKYIITTVFAFLSIFSATGADYELKATCNIEDSSGGGIKTIINNTLTHKQEQKGDTFIITPTSVRFWMEPRTKETEQLAKKAGTPIDGTSFSPIPKTILSFSFDAEQKSCIGKNTSEQGSIDLINLMFFCGNKAPLRTENIAVMKPEYAKQFEFPISEYSITLFVYWYDSLKRNNEAEAPTYLIIAKDKANKLIASRVFYQAVKTTTREVCAFDLRAVQTDVDLNEIVEELNKKLNEGFSLKTMK